MPSEIEVISRLLLAAVLGTAIDFQRERAGKPARLRTHSLICLGSSLFTVVSILGFGFGADPPRVAAGTGMYLVTLIVSIVTVGVLMLPKVRG